MKPFLCLLLCAGFAAAQVPGNASLNGKYWFRSVHMSADANSNVTAAVSLAGSLTFNGSGTFTYTATENLGAAANMQISGGGTYTVQSNGFVTFTSPANSGLTMNGRLGAKVLVASTTEGQSTMFDLLIAIPAPASGASAASLTGTYQVGALEFPSGATANVRSSVFNFTSDGKSSLGSPVVTGHAANLLGGAGTSQTVTAATYTINADGSGTATFPVVSGNTAAMQLVSGVKTIYISADGNYVIGGSTAAGGFDILFGESALAGGTANDASLIGLYLTSGLSYVAGSGGGFSAYAGSANSGGAGNVLFHRRYHAPQGTIDFTGSNTYGVITDGTGSEELDRIAVGATGYSWLAACAGDVDATLYELSIAVIAPGASGTGVFLSPMGVVNAASLAPVGSPVAPGEYVSLFGVNLAAAPGGATGFPIPTILAGVTVAVNGTPAPLNYVSPGQINLLIPFKSTGSTATFVVTNGGSTSNTVTVPLAATAPGIFSQDSSGSNLGVVLHANYALVTNANPAKVGETVLVYMTGLGAVNPPVGDGAQAPPGPNTANVTAAFSVLIDNQNAAISYQGLAPGFAGLYQLNIVIPNGVTHGQLSLPLAISTSVAFLDQVGIVVQ